jgi:UDP-N-acetylmuramoyl-tripeptide--D-alanyl-D-alanine ligase
MEAALDTLAAIGRRTGRRTVAVLGEMKELGEESRSGHLRVGRFAAAAAVDVLVVVGEPARAIAEGATRTGGIVHVAAGRDEALEWVRNNVSADDVVLVKASRGAALEHIADGLLEGPTP